MKKIEEMKDAVAVVLGMGPTALGLVRALGRKDVPVYGIGLNRYEVALSSRYCRRLGAADPRYQSQRLLDLLLEFVQNHSQNHKLILYPTGDECVVFIAENHEILSKYYIFSKLDPEVLDLFLNKARFYEACIQYGLPAPKSYIPKRKSGLIDIAEKVEFPCIIKPKYYHRWAVKHGLKKAIFCRDSSELLDFFRKSTENLTDFIVQEVIDGPEENIYVVAAYMDRNSRPHGVFVGQKIRQYPVGFGTTTMIKTASVPELKEMSVTFLKKLGYQGLVDVEFKYDKRTKSFYVIEINPRVGRWYGIVEAAGHDTVYYSYLDLSDQALYDHIAESRQVTWAFVLRDILSVLKNRRWRISNIFQSYAGPRTWCIWAIDDIKPFFSYFGEIVSKGLQALWRKSH